MDPVQEKKLQKIILISMGIIFFCYSMFAIVAHAPSTFPINEGVRIPSGNSLSSIAETLKEKNVIRSKNLFVLYIKLVGKDNELKAGTYYFSKKVSFFAVAHTISRGDYNTPLLKVTIPEGTSVSEIADLVKKLAPEFDDVMFANIALKDEGFLFPDTYFVPPTISTEEMKDVMRKTFDKKILEIEDQLFKFGKPLKDVITMASILEEEARTMETRRIIAGILWKRLSMGMPLQVDAAFLKVNGKTTFDLTNDDLKIDSPYNTYKYKGLPPGPLSNPGMESILAAITPISSSYLYYLTDHEGVMRYSATFEGHIANKQKYLK